MSIRSVGFAALRSPRLIAVTSRRRKRLLFCFVLCFLQSFYVWFLVGELDSMWMVEEFPSQRPINWTMEEVEARSYLEALVRGNAEIAAVVERPKLPEVRLGCADIRNVSIREPGDWLEVDRWFLFGAYEDRRSNSLYPKLSLSVQLIASTFHVVEETRERWFCHLWDGEGQLIRVAAHFRLIWQRAWDPRLTFQNPYLITCGVPNDFQLSENAAVTIRGRRCPPRDAEFLRIRQITEALQETEADQKKLRENRWLLDSQRIWAQNEETIDSLAQNEGNIVDLGKNAEIEETDADSRRIDAEADENWNQREKRNALVGNWAQHRQKKTTKIPKEQPKINGIEETGGELMENPLKSEEMSRGVMMKPEIRKPIEGSVEAVMENPQKNAERKIHRKTQREEKITKKLPSPIHQSEEPKHFLKLPNVQKIAQSQVAESPANQNPQTPPKIAENVAAVPIIQRTKTGIQNSEFPTNGENDEHLEAARNHEAEFPANENIEESLKYPNAAIGANQVNGNTNPAEELPRIGVCVKGLDFFEDRSRSLVEWTLLQFALGAHSVTLYVYYIPPKTRRILEAIATDFPLRIRNLTLPGRGVNNEPKARHEYIWNDVAQKRRNELIPYNDCFYRYAPTYDYILLVDTDEVVVPRRHSDWSQMIAEFTKNFRSNATSLSVRNVFKFGDDDSLLERRRRSRRVQPNGVSGKSFMSTKTAATVFNHFALHRLHGDTVRTAYFPPRTALKLHFKSDCPVDVRKECLRLKAETIADHSLDRWRSQILQLANMYLRVE